MRYADVEIFCNKYISLERLSSDHRRESRVEQAKKLVNRLREGPKSFDLSRNIRGRHLRSASEVGARVKGRL